MANQAARLVVGKRARSPFLWGGGYVPIALILLVQAALAEVEPPGFGPQDEALVPVTLERLARFRSEEQRQVFAYRFACPQGQGIIVFIAYRDDPRDIEWEIAMGSWRKHRIIYQQHFPPLPATRGDRLWADLDDDGAYEIALVAPYSTNINPC